MAFAAWDRNPTLAHERWTSSEIIDPGYPPGIHIGCEPVPAAP
jgi:hypothetical protein